MEMIAQFLDSREVILIIRNTRIRVAIHTFRTCSRLFHILFNEQSWDLRVSHSRGKLPQLPSEMASHSGIQRSLGCVPLSEASRCPSAHRTRGIRIQLVAFATRIVPWAFNHLSLGGRGPKLIDSWLFELIKRSFLSLSRADF